MDMPRFMTKDAPLAPMTAFGIGGRAKWLATPGNRDELLLAAKTAAELGLPLLTLGGGSNLLVADSGVNAVVVHLDAGGGFGRIEQHKNDPLLWCAGAAAPLASFVAATIDKGVSGLEAMAGIPGRVGGALAMNAGAWNCSMGDCVTGVTAFDPARGECRMLSGKELGFGYRRSQWGLSGMIALRAQFCFSEKAGRDAVIARARECRDRKKASQPLGKPSAGCVFRNPPGDAAGALLDKAGCKAMREGGAEVSSLHANFIINRGGATAADVARLAVRMRDAVREKFGTVLEPELMLWGGDPAFDALVTV